MTLLIVERGIIDLVDGAFGARCEAVAAQAASIRSGTLSSQAPSAAAARAIAYPILPVEWLVR